MKNFDITKNIQNHSKTDHILKTKYLFLNLLAMFKPRLVLDVGSMDGSDSIRFTRMSAKSKIIAFEANPYNYAKMRDNQHLAKLNIDVRNQLVSTSKNKGAFYISTGSKSDDISSNRGMSSSLMPVDSESVAEKIEVDTTRLDEVITKEIKLTDFVALWIDVEGAGYEVLSSIINAKQQIAFIHIEVELKEFWVGQKLKHDVIRLGEELGLVLLANSKHETQQDLILINSRMFAEHFWTVKLAMFLTKWIGPASSRMLEIFKHTY